MIEQMFTDFDRHLKAPEIDIETHVRRTHIQHAESRNGRRAIFLDTKYWIDLINVVCGTTTSEPLCWVEILLRVLREGVARGTLFCPVTEKVLDEIMNQSDDSSRTLTISLVDELSAGYALVPTLQRISIEVACFLYLYHDVDEFDLWPPKFLVWTRPSSLLASYPWNPMFSRETNAAIRKTFFDRWWGTSLQEMLATSDRPPSSPKNKNADLRINSIMTTDFTPPSSRVSKQHTRRKCEDLSTS